MSECIECPSCGGAGGGPFGPANSAWDTESFTCTRCKGVGSVERSIVVVRPGVAKAAPTEIDSSKKKSA